MCLRTKSQHLFARGSTVVCLQRTCLFSQEEHIHLLAMITIVCLCRTLFLLVGGHLFTGKRTAHLLMRAIFIVRAHLFVHESALAWENTFVCSLEHICLLARAHLISHDSTFIWSWERIHSLVRAPLFDRESSASIFLWEHIWWCCSRGSELFPFVMDVPEGYSYLRLWDRIHFQSHIHSLVRVVSIRLYEHIRLL